jgi:hypothetical protein
MANASAVIAELQKLTEDQLFKWQYDYSASGVIKNNSTASLTTTIQQDADFLVTHITGKLFGPTDASGVVYTGETTDFPTPGDNALSASGLSFKMTDQGAGRELSSDFIPFELILTPGYSTILYQPFPFKYLLRRNSTLRFDIRNRDTKSKAGGGDLYHSVSIMLHGYKYDNVVSQKVKV